MLICCSWVKHMGENLIWINKLYWEKESSKVQGLNAVCFTINCVNCFISSMIWDNCSCSVNSYCQDGGTQFCILTTKKLNSWPSEFYQQLSFFGRQDGKFIEKCVSHVAVYSKAHMKQSSSTNCSHFSLPLTRPANTMKIRLPKFGKIKVDHHIHSLNVNSSRKQIWIIKKKVKMSKTRCKHALAKQKKANVQVHTCADKISAQPIPEIMEYAVPMFLCRWAQ